MKIDKIVFSCSEYYAPFWNIQSQIWKTKFDIEPVCLLFGQQSNIPGMTDKHGEIIEVPFNKDLPDIIQIQFSKFHQPTKELEKTWLIGDMDQVPLQTGHFLRGLESIDENAYVHFNYTLCAQMMGLPGEVYKKRGAYVNGGFDLPGHYHCAKGRHYNDLFFAGMTLEDVIKYVIESKRYGMIKEDAQQNLNKQIHGSFWVAEEMYTSERIWYGYRKKVISDFIGKSYHIWDQKIDRVGRMGGQWNGTDYVYDEQKVRDHGYVDIHCHRPFHEQEKPLMKILELAGMV